MRALLLAALAAGFAVGPSRARAAAVEESSQARENSRIKARQDLTVLGDRISALELKANSDKTPAGAALKSRAAELRAKKSDADQLLEQLGTAKDDALPGLRTRLDGELGDLKTSLDKAEHPGG
jgi:hypothetical protein